MAGELHGKRIMYVGDAQGFRMKAICVQEEVGGPVGIKPWHEPGRVVHQLRELGGQRITLETVSSPRFCLARISRRSPVAFSALTAVKPGGKFDISALSLDTATQELGLDPVCPGS